MAATATGAQATAELAEALPYRDAIVVSPQQMAEYKANGFTKVMACRRGRGFGHFSRCA